MLKKYTLLMLLIMLAVIGADMGTARAMASYEAVGSQAVTSGIQDLGRLKITIPAAEVQDNHYFTVGLPSGFRFNLDPGALYPLAGAGPDFTLDGGDHLTITIPQANNAFYDPSGTYGNASINVEVLTDNEIKVNLLPAAVVNNNGEKAYLYMNLKGILVPADAPAIIQATVEGPGFSSPPAEAPTPAPVVLLDFSAAGGVVDSPAGVRDLAIHPLIIREGIKSALNPDTVNGQLRNTVRIEFPQGVTCSAPTSVEVTSGDLGINQTSLRSQYDPSVDRWGIEFEVKSGSTQPSTIKIDGIKLELSRGLEAGKVQAYLKGDAILKTLAEFPGQTSISSTPVVNIINPPPSDIVKELCFFVGSTSYTLNGAGQTMDVAPLVKDDRVLLPVRFVAQAMGTSIDWDEALQVATLIRGDRIVQFTIGSPVIKVNNTTVTMDVAAEIEAGRTMVPVRYLAQALGYQVVWNEAAQSVVIK
ncbi:MAG TPA: copper amine oxidase N-terminal domain-containing protein [Syntrophomonadaceae bacterium]|nr:copper amine oxidase N-terminal domain-containing protein [Syntrophomonadaceae bacterium]